MINKKLIDINDYEKLEFIGGGSYGKVYTYRNKTTNAIYAVKKIVQYNSNINSKLTKQFIREVKILSKINHPSILRFIGYQFIERKNVFKIIILTEYFKNGSLYNVLHGNDNQYPYGWNDTKKAYQYLRNCVSNVIFTLAKNYSSRFKVRKYT